MTATDLLLDLRRQGFSLIPEGGGIRIKPASSVTPDLRQAVREQRTGLLVLLQRPRWDPTPEEEAKICSWIEKDKGLPAGTIRLYTPEDYLRRFGE